MSKYFKPSLPSSTLSDIQKGQTTTVFDENVWQELKPRVKKVASFVSLQFLLSDGTKVKTEGDLFLYKTVFLEKDKNEEASEKLELYIQRIQRSNQLIAFEMRIPPRQDLTRYCSRLPKSQVRSSTWQNPVLLFALVYTGFLNILQFLASAGFEIDFTSAWFVGLNVGLVVSLAWYAYVEVTYEGFWATLYELDQTQLTLALNIQRQIAGRTTHNINVRRSLNVYRVQIFYSEVMHTEALSFKQKDLAKVIDEENKKKIQDLTDEKHRLDSKLEQMKTQLDSAHQALESASNRIRKAYRDGFVMRGKFEGEPLFEHQGEPILQNLIDSKALHYAVFGAVTLVIFYIIWPFIQTIDWGLPELSLFWQVIIFLCFLVVLGFMFVTAFIKAMKVT